MLAVFFARALGWESNRLDTRSPVYERLPLFRVCLASAYVQGNVVGADLRAARGGVTVQARNRPARRSGPTCPRYENGRFLSGLRALPKSAVRYGP